MSHRKMRTLNIPQRVEVEVENEKPKAVRRSGGDAAQWIDAILECWRIDDEWWRQPISRQCYAVVLESGGRVVVFDDLVTGEWWMQKP